MENTTPTTIKISSFSEALDATGTASSAIVGFNWLDGTNNFATSITILPADIHDNEALDDKSKNEICKLAAKKLLSLVTTVVTAYAGA